MNQQNQGMSSFSPDPPMKRKRGRPRKDESLVHGESMTAIPGSDSLKKNKPSVGKTDEVEDEMVGRMVSGVIEGSFDAGYLLNVKVGDTDTQLRGVVFMPGRFTPVTAANDIAPNVKMCKRKELPIPSRPTEQSNRQPIEVKNPTPTVPNQTPTVPNQTPTVPNQTPSVPNQTPPIPNQTPTVPNQTPTVPNQTPTAPNQTPPVSNQTPTVPNQTPTVPNQTPPVPNQTPTVPDHTQPSTVQSGIPESLQNQSSSVIFPLVDNFAKNDAVPFLGGKVMPQKFLEPGPDSQSAPVMAQSEHDKVDEQDKVLNEVEAATIMKGPNGVEGNEASKGETAPESIADIPGVETISKNTQIQPQAVGSEESPSVHDEVKSLNLELNKTPVFAEPAPTSVIPGVETIYKDPQFQAQAVASEKSALVHDAVRSLNLELNQAPEFAEPAATAVIPSIETVCKDPQIQPQDVGSEKNALVPDVVTSLNLELNQAPVFAEPACVSSDPTSESANDLMEEQVYSAPKPSQMFGGEAVPSESKLASEGSEGSIPPIMVEPHISSSSGVISNVECDMEDVIPPTES